MARVTRKVNPLQPASAPVAPAGRSYRVGGYARLSVEDSGKPGADTIETQKSLILDYINAQPDMAFCGLYCDNGHTGTNFERPAFESLLEDVKRGKIDCIVVKDLSRFGRNYKETGNYLERIFPFLDVRFVAVNDHFDTMTAQRTSDGYIVPLKNIINEVYSKDISRKSGSALAVKQRNGDFIGAWAAYGYQKCKDNPRKIEPDTETAPVVREIFQWRLSGMSYVKIARELNEQGIPSPSRYRYLRGDIKSERLANTVWKQQVVKSLLCNEVYLGHMVQGRKRESLYEGKKQRQLPKSEWVVVKNTHAPLIEEETFLAVQEIAAQKQDDYRERLGIHDHLGTSENLLKGLVFCADCKRPLVRYKSVTCNGTKVDYRYICPTHADNPASCPKKYIPETELTGLLWDILQNQLTLADDISSQMRSFRASAQSSRLDNGLCRQIAAAEQSLKRAKLLHDNLYQMYAEDKLLTEQEYTEMKRDYRTQMEQAQHELDRLETQKKAHAAQTERNPWLTTCASLQTETELTSELAHALLECVEVSADHQLTVTLRYRDEHGFLTELLAEAGKGAST